MTTLIVTKPTVVGTKLTGAEMPSGIVPATVTSVKDLGMQPAFEKGQPDVHQVEFVFTSPNGEQISKRSKVSIHEKSFVYQLAVAANGNPPNDGFDISSLEGRNVALVTTRKPQTMGKNAGKLKTYISTVTGPLAGQQTAKAPVAAAQVPATSQVGW